MSLASYPSKILLFGEYTILNGSHALALPYSRFSGSWSFVASDKKEESELSLRKFLAHQCQQSFDFLKLKNDLDKGLWFDSHIPHGFGIGSSGALIAALYDTYGKISKELSMIREDLARLEDFFHGSSSGIDPLVSFVKKPLHIKQMNDIHILEKEINLSKFFLVNTQKPRQTGPLVQIYQEKLKDPEFKKGCSEILVREVNMAIKCTIEDRPEDLFHHLWHISKFQWEYFPEMIPTQFRSMWLKGIESGDFIFKLCGAGGGGYILGYNHRLNENQKSSIFKDFETLYF